MNDEDRVDLLKFISQTYRELHQQRRHFEIKAFIVTLSAYGFTTLAVFKGEVEHQLDPVVKKSIWITFIVIAIVTILFLRGIHKANRRNITLAEEAEDEIIRLVGVEKLDLALQKVIRNAGYPYWAWGWQALIIFFVAIACAFIVTNQC